MGDTARAHRSRLQHMFPPCTAEGADLTLRASLLAGAVGWFATMHDGPAPRAAARPTGTLPAPGAGRALGGAQASCVEPSLPLRSLWQRVRGPPAPPPPQAPFGELARASLRGGAASGALVFACLGACAARCPGARAGRGLPPSIPGMSNAGRTGTYTAVRCTIQAARGRKLADGPSSVLGGAAAGAVVALSRPTVRSAGASMLLGAGCGFVYHYVRVRVLRERLGLSG